MSEPTRRTVLKAAGWTVPAIAVAIAVPAASASTNPPTEPQPPKPTVKDARASLRLTNSTLTPNAHKLAASGNTKVQNDSPTITFAGLTVALIVNGQTVHAFPLNPIPPYGNSGIIDGAPTFTANPTPPATYPEVVPLSGPGAPIEGRWIIFYEGEIIVSVPTSGLDAAPGWWFQ